MRLHLLHETVGSRQMIDANQHEDSAAFGGHHRELREPLSLPLREDTPG